MDKVKFYDVIRPSVFGGKISQSQVDGIEAILTACKDLTDNRHVAYILGTCFHETGKTMQPVEEIGKGKGRPYGQKIKRNGKPYETPDHLYYGRGDVQLTWYENYEYIGKLIGEDLLNHPEKCLELEISAKIIVLGMTKGCFTGVKLDTYFNSTREDWVDARKIINSLDCANRIAGYAQTFLRGLEA